MFPLSIRGRTPTSWISASAATEMRPAAVALGGEGGARQRGGRGQRRIRRQGQFGDAWITLVRPWGHGVMGSWQRQREISAGLNTELLLKTPPLVKRPPEDEAFQNGSIGKSRAQ